MQSPLRFEIETSVQQRLIAAMVSAFDRGTLDQVLKIRKRIQKPLHLKTKIKILLCQIPDQPRSMIWGWFKAIATTNHNTHLFTNKLNTKIMHICYVLGTFPTTSETFVSDEIISCVKAGHKVTITRIYQGNAVNHANVEWIKSNVKIIDIKPPINATDSLKFLISACVIQKSVNPLLLLLTHHPRWAMTAMLPTFKQLCHEKIDHIHAHFADKQVLFAHALSALMNVPFSFTMHGYDIRDLPIGKDNLFRVIKAAKCPFTVSAANISALKLIGANTSKFNIIPCGIDTSKFATPSKPYTEGELVIACVARLHPIKNHKTLLQALSMLDKSIKFHLKIIGDGELDPEN